MGVKSLALKGFRSCVMALFGWDLSQIFSQKAPPVQMSEPTWRYNEHKFEKDESSPLLYCLIGLICMILVFMLIAIIKLFLTKKRSVQRDITLNNIPRP